MKKSIILGALAFTIVGGIGSLYTTFNTLPKFNRYMNSRRMEMIKDVEILNSPEKINSINFDKFSGNPTVYIKKSTDNHTKVTVSSLNGNIDYKANIKDGSLNFKRVSDSYKKMSGIGEMSEKDAISSLLLPNRKNVGEILDYMAVSGTRANKYYIGNDWNFSSFKVVIEVPESVNLSFNGNNSNWFDIPRKLDVEEGMIKDSLTVSDSLNIRNIDYNGTINNVVVNGMESKDSNADLQFLYSIDHSKTHIKKLTMNIDANVKLYNGIKADEIVMNIKNKKEPYDNNTDWGLFNKESEFARFCIETAEGNSDYEDGIAEKINKLDDKRKFEEKFKDEVDYARQTIESHGYDSDQVAKHFYNMFDINIPVFPEMANRLVINAPESKVRIILEENFNPKMVIKTKDGIDTRFFLVDKIPSYLIPTKNSIKEINESIYGYVKKLDKNYRTEKEVLKPEIVLNSKSAYIVDQEIND